MFKFISGIFIFQKFKKELFSVIFIISLLILFNFIMNDISIYLSESYFILIKWGINISLILSIFFIIKGKISLKEIDSKKEIILEKEKLLSKEDKILKKYK
ncbi:MAG: hypothetical protein U9Q30_03045 [Campylobacterota bacterium]|nr:hypothetical protein [Campylobacterota bacterium]